MRQPERRATCRRSLSLLSCMTMTAAGAPSGLSIRIRSQRSGPGERRDGEGDYTMTQFTDRIVLITGAGRGIGRAMALRFAREGAQIVAVDIEPALAESTAAAVQELGRQCLPLKVDVTQQADIQRMVTQTIDQFKRIDVLCNNAGVLRFQEMFDINEADWDFVLDVNTKGAFFVMQAVAREMVKRRSGKIVNTASISGKQPEPHFLHYGVSKAGVIHMTKSAAAVLAPYNINVNAVCPGTTVTAMSLMATAGRAKIM